MMADIVDNEENDRDTVEPEELEQMFSKKYKIVTEHAVSLLHSYIHRLDGTKSLNLAISLSDNSIEIYKLSDSSLHQVCRLHGHKEATLTQVVFSPKEDNLLYSTGLDGLVKLWDIRAGGSCVLEYKDEEEEILRPYECMDVSCNGIVLCTGSQLVDDDAYLVFFDQRKPKPLGGYWNSHTDDVTQIKFHPTRMEILVSGSLDGLINVYNIVEETEEDALLYSLNVENSIDTLSWLDGEHVGCVTQSNDYQLWNAISGDIVKEYERDKVSRSIKRSKEDDCYLVDSFTSAEGRRVLLAGSHAGSGDVLRSVAVVDKKLQPCSNFKDNKQVVRSCWYSAQHDILVTSGESGILSVWGDCQSEPEAPEVRKLTDSLSKLQDGRHKPY